jgi:exopolyphosphatase/guanosine-5'-triphosphate,3'-diphosphate pyrophosphatase
MNTADAREEVLALMQALEEEPHHVQHVAALALQLFDELGEVHGLGDMDRFILEAGSLLHDIGWSVSYEGPGHHRQSARLIREHGWKNLPRHAVDVIAQVARYHRKNLPDLEHEDYAALSPSERQRVQKLAAILRIAVGLDRGHQQHVTGVSAAIFPDRLAIRLHSSHPCSREIGSAIKKADLATAVFHRPVVFEVVLESRA